MNKSVFVYGPQGTGKTLHAAALAKHYGLSKIRDEYHENPLKRPQQTDTLFLSQERPAWADDTDRRVLPIAVVLQQAGLKAAR